MTVEWGWEKWTQTIFSILLIKQTKSIPQNINYQTNKNNIPQNINYQTNKNNIPQIINYFLLPIIEKLIIFGWGWGKVACQGFYHLGGGEQKVSQKQPGKK